MSEQEKINSLEEIMDLEEGTLEKDDLLEDYPEWDSIAALAFIAFIDEKYHKTISGQDLKALKTVADAIGIME